MTLSSITRSVVRCVFRSMDCHMAHSKFSMTRATPSFSDSFQATLKEIEEETMGWDTKIGRNKLIKVINTPCFDFLCVLLRSIYETALNCKRIILNIIVGEDNEFEFKLVTFLAKECIPLLNRFQCFDLHNRQRVFIHQRIDIQTQCLGILHLLLVIGYPLRW